MLETLEIFGTDQSYYYDFVTNFSKISDGIEYAIKRSKNLRKF